MLDVLKTKSTYSRMILSAIPLVAVCSTAANALIAAVISLVAVLLAGICISALKPFLNDKTAPFAQIIIAVGVIGILSMVGSLFAKELISDMSAYLPLIAVTTVLLLNADFALNNTVVTTLIGGGIIGGASSLFIICCGILREILGRGSLFGIELYTPWFSPIEFFATPAGGLFTAAVLAIVYNLLVGKLKNRKEAEV